MINVAIPQEVTPAELRHFVADCQPVAGKVRRAVAATVLNVTFGVNAAVAYGAMKMKNVTGKMADAYLKKNLKDRHLMILPSFC